MPIGQSRDEPDYHSRGFSINPPDPLEYVLEIVSSPQCVSVAVGRPSELEGSAPSLRSRWDVDYPMAGSGTGPSTPDQTRARPLTSTGCSTSPAAWNLIAQHHAAMQIREAPRRHLHRAEPRRAVQLHDQRDHAGTELSRAAPDASEVCRACRPWIRRRHCEQWPTSSGAPLGAPAEGLPDTATPRRSLRPRLRSPDSSSAPAPEMVSSTRAGHGGLRHSFAPGRRPGPPIGRFLAKRGLPCCAPAARNLTLQAALSFARMGIVPGSASYRRKHAPRTAYRQRAFTPNTPVFGVASMGRPSMCSKSCEGAQLPARAP